MSGVEKTGRRIGGYGAAQVCLVWAHTQTERFRVAGADSEAQPHFPTFAGCPAFLEYEEVLKRPDLFPGDIAHADRLLDRLARVSRLVTNLPSGRPRLRDPDDEMVLDAALDSGASAIVTFNKANFRPTGPKLGLSLLAPGEFLRILR